MTKILLFLALLAGCNGLTDTNEKDGNEELAEEEVITLNYLALGDSYTIGESVSETERFPYQLIHSEFSKPHDIGNYKIIARTGWTTRDLLDAMDKEVLEAGQWDFITLLIGVNNQYQGKPFSQYEKEFNELMDRAIALLEGDASRLIVVSIPDYSVTPFAASRDPEKIATELKRYNDYNEKIAKERDAQYVYITDLTQDAKDDLSLLAEDQLHPSGKNYGQWVERMVPKVEGVIEN
ncbi:SGNH/GDSL hydrolase family protein [Portibacter marinus]|uniref:SGNH/GDSL hydrolase family protein n=1 Tax=Portibacter marinus TaxID=2898660 RepID=UPI001F41DB13|nr:SGNH/GDSL hydrolase family protein [Portibacter marinus]